MKTTFTAEDIGKEFETKISGVTAKFIGFNTSNDKYPCKWEYSNGGHWFTDKNGFAYSPQYDVFPNRPVNRKTYTEEQVRKAIELARTTDLIERILTEDSENNLCMYTPDEIINKLTP